MGTLLPNCFQSFGGCFGFWVFFNRLEFVFASGDINETSSPPVSRVYCKAKQSAFKRAQEERMKESVGKYRSTIGRFVFGRTKFMRSSWIAHFAVDILLQYSTIMGAIYLIFQISTVQSMDHRNPKYEQKIIKNEGLIVYLRNFSTFEQFRSENIWSKSTLYLTVSLFVSFFSQFF